VIIGIELTLGIFVRETQLKNKKYARHHFPSRARFVDSRAFRDVKTRHNEPYRRANLKLGSLPRSVRLHEERL